MSSRARSLLFTVSLLVAAPLLFGAKGGCGGDVVIGDDECAKSACGGMPEIACADGSIPFTGRCLAKSDGQCGWEPRTCPGVAATCDECAIPEIGCANGGPGPYQGCELKDGKCVGKFIGCAGDPCTTEMCGPAIRSPSYTCEDGTLGGNTGRCLRNTDGKCGWQVIDCPRKCTDAECGAPPPVAPCPGGTGPTVTCARRADATCGWNVGECMATACEKVTSLSRACTTKADCTYGIHQINCCGSEQAMGYATSGASSFTTFEPACRNSYPGCGCAQMPTVDDSGKTGSEFAVDCVSGVCTTTATKGI